ncbi:MAG: hypothetical protein S4CHLAM123_05660 [Chlamydiales bacterium]|nr:hypothetical protein [Chlamydiales bacterium]
MLKRLFLFIFFFSFPLQAEQSMEELCQALETAAYWDQKLHERFAVTYNHLLSTGIFTTHSARMSEAGSMGFGISSVPPYLNWNGRMQPFCHLECSVNYKVFRGIQDASIGQYGFGDYADRGANLKYAFFTPEDTLYAFPGLAIGVDDFMGSKKFTTYYIVGTQIWLDWGLECSFGWGAGTYTKGPSRGFFGGVNWLPLWECSNAWVRGICISAEYDPTNYKNDPHPGARNPKTPINVGAKYIYKEFAHLSASYVRGEELAVAGSFHCNWGALDGFIPKVRDSALYTAPIDREPLGCVRPQNVMIQNMNYALESQGFQLTKAWIQNGSDLWLRVINNCYRQECVARERLKYLLASLTPSNISTVVVIIESNALACQQYVFNRQRLLDSVEHRIGPYEFDLLTPRQEACACQPVCSDCIFQRRYDLWRGRLSPRFETFLGSSKGKFKYDVGLKLDLEGFLPCQWYYEFQISQTALSTLNNVGDFDFFYPSQLLNVATDYVRYRTEGAFTWDKIYLQKSWNFGRGFFGRASGGYFQVNYGGIAGEALWYPVNSLVALGVEGAVVKKRSYTGLGFQSKIRRFKGRDPLYVSVASLQQYFLSLYLDFPNLEIFSKISVGQFLARDKGVRLEGTRYFRNGLRITGWITYTNANDCLHGEKYYDKGVALEVPLDFFYRCSSRKVWNYGMAAWLRDAGYATTTGKTLFETLNRERRF